MKSSKNYLAFTLLLLSGIVLGGLMGELASKAPMLSFLNYGKAFGIGAGTPMILDLAVMQITFGISFQLTVSVILGIVISIIVYKKI